jgi:hypothetical protein
MENFRFITQITNPCGSGPTLEEYAEKLLKQAAGVAAPYGDDCKPDTEKGQVASESADKEFQKGESVDGKKDETTKSAPKAEKKDAPEKEEKEEKEASVKSAAGKAKAEDAKGDGIEISLAADKEFQKGESVDGSKVTPDNKKVKASGDNWVKISNLNASEKKMLKSYWTTLYPREYVDAMIADK